MSGYFWEKPGSRFYLGLDLGQARDYSAIAVAERRIELTGARDPIFFTPHTTVRVIVRYLERIPLRTAYPDVVERVRQVAHRFNPPGHNLTVYVDATGVGAAVKDMMYRARIGVTILGVTVTGGERVTVSPGAYHVPRQDLLANVRVLLEQRLLEIEATGPAAQALKTELLAWGKRSAHDDLIFATALACWKAGGQPLSLYGPGPLPMVHPEVRR